jgi:uncharacterized protein YndB with AHSA1/START domain
MNALARNTSLAERELTITRAFDAPRALVFAAWTDPKHLAQWWGPKGFTNPVCEFDARVGGAIRIHMRSPDGTIYPMTGEVREFIPPERLVFTTFALDGEGNPILEGLAKVVFAGNDGRTTMTLHVRAAAVAEVALPHLQGMEAGWTQSLERLQAFMAAAT